LKVIALILITLVILFLILSYLNSRPLTRDQAISEIEQIAEKSLNDKKSIHSVLLYVDAPQKGFESKIAFGNTTGADQPFHVASVGKLFTATLIGRLVDEEKIGLDDPINLYLQQEVLDNLFVFEGVDHQDEVTIRQLLSHTSGVADYFAKEDNGLIETLYQTPDVFYTPMDLIHYTQENQKAVFAPGDGYHYTDTGYILLGLIIESVTGKPFHENLHEVIFDPLKMEDTYLMFYSEPKNSRQLITEAWINGHEVSRNRSVSIDWAGGGVISTLKDLAIFIRALNQGEIISIDTLNELTQFENRFIPGIAYGNGFMQMRFEEFFPTLGNLPKMTGHMGVLGTQLFYDQATDLVYVSSFGSSDGSAASVRTMIQVLSVLERIQ